MDFRTYGSGETRPDNKATHEHRMPISKGGGNTWENSVLACWRRNITKGSRTEEEFLKMRGGDAA